jgi:hypothetical protein
MREVANEVADAVAGAARKLEHRDRVPLGAAQRDLRLAVQQKSPRKPSFTIELANGSYGYLPTPRHHALEGYETWLGTNRVEVEASEKIVRTILELFKGLRP